jgi:hypothetical protein
METKSFKPYFFVIGLMAATSLLLAFSVNVQMTNEVGIKVMLPERVGYWQGVDIFYCQNQACQKEYRASEAGNSNLCASCGSPLGVMTLAEKRLLPDDTILLRKEYTNSLGHRLFVMIVLSGKERVSIHRPQICLVGQGHEITRSKVVSVPLEGRRSLDVMTLELLRRMRNDEGTQFESASYYAYWFVGKGRETPRHLKRMFWMAIDQIFHNVSHRWAYISVSGSRSKDSDEYRQEVVSFIKDLYPQLVPDSG